MFAQNNNMVSNAVPHISVFETEASLQTNIMHRNTFRGFLPCFDGHTLGMAYLIIPARQIFHSKYVSIGIRAFITHPSFSKE